MPPIYPDAVMPSRCHLSKPAVFLFMRLSQPSPSFSLQPSRFLSLETLTLTAALAPILAAMGVSFKICRVGSRCCPKVPHLVEAVTADIVDHEGGEAAQEGNSGDREVSGSTCLRFMFLFCDDFHLEICMLSLQAILGFWFCYALVSRILLLLVLI